MNNIVPNFQWSENVILANADYVDHVAFNLICNFERMLGRRVPQADLARWIDCVALDGGLRPVADGAADALLPTTQVVLLHTRERQAMENFVPANYSDELDGKAFSDQLGEFIISAYPTTDMADIDTLFAEVLQTVCAPKEVKRVMVIPNAEDSTQLARVMEVLKHADAQDSDKRITFFSMQPLSGGAFRQEILGYSLMAALGIRGDEFK